jgi:hypothetical protein
MDLAALISPDDLATIEEVRLALKRCEQGSYGYYEYRSADPLTALARLLAF